MSFPFLENVSGMTATRTAKEGRVNVPLGDAKTELKAIATKEGTTESNLARVLIIDGIQRIQSGEMKFKGPSLEPAKTETAPEPQEVGA